MALAQDGRSNQKARTRAALLDAAVQLVREGRPPSIPEVAERALISVATAYRYFPSPDELWVEATYTALTYRGVIQHILDVIDAAGADPRARIEACARSFGATMLDDEATHRWSAKAALDHWFAQVDTPPEDRTPVREGRRREHIDAALEPLRGRLPEDVLERITNALIITVGTDAVLAVRDVGGLDGQEALQTLGDAARWTLIGALAELASDLG